jgi:carboxymethylenebutenolidase
MCAPFDSEPPIPPIAGAAITHRLLELEAPDGNRLAAFEALPDDEPAGLGVVILPDVRGLFHFYEELALRFAEVGVAAVTIDYFGRTAGVSRRDEDFPYMDYVVQTTADDVQADVTAGVARLREHGIGRIYTVGFCFGGRHSWLASAGGHDLAGVVGFYGRPGVGRYGEPGPIQRASELHGPLLGLMGGADEAIPVSEVDAFDAALTEVGVTHDLVTYDGAPHSFFDRRFTEHADASADAWRRVLEFIGAPRR